MPTRSPPRLSCRIPKYLMTMARGPFRFSRIVSGHADYRPNYARAPRSEAIPPVRALATHGPCDCSLFRRRGFSLLSLGGDADAGPRRAGGHRRFAVVSTLTQT